MQDLVFWIDIFNGPHVHFFQKSHLFLQNIFYTARHYKPIPELLDLYKTPIKIIGRHGGRTAMGKLLASSRRIMELAKYMQDRPIDVALHKHSVEAARVAWGLGLPSISFIDNELMVPQNMLVCPLSNVLIAPIAIEQSVLRNFTPAHVSILQFDGVSEVANVYDYKPDPAVLDLLNLSSHHPIVVIRSEPVLAAYHNQQTLVNQLIEKIEADVPDAQVIKINREGEALQRDWPVFDARSLLYYADLVISGGGTMTREAALLGTRAITFFDNPLAVDRYLIQRGLLESYPGKEIFKLNFRQELIQWKRIKRPEGFEHPFALLEKAVKLLQIKKERSDGAQT
jgi:predicted glycosyltransferase